METKVRSGMFESNSSSSHSVTVEPGDVHDRNFSKDSIRAGVVVLTKPVAEYDQWLRFYMPENILTFMIVAEVEDQDHRRGPVAGLIPKRRKDGHDALPALCEHYPGVRRAIAHLRRSTGLEFRFVVDREDDGIFRTGSLEVHAGFFDDVNRLDALLFNSGSYVQLTEENGWPDETVPTDLGTTVDSGFRWTKNGLFG